MPGAEEKKISRWVIQGFHSQSVGKIAAAAPFLIRSDHSPLSLTHHRSSLIHTHHSTTSISHFISP
ncbi:hypothetical protein PGTUg99_005528 [Puccinia graminis f. sp. tritici]|uniref:Uncharacterized protein n=1 Tax=Puccinia graminis f. sp. tritici TaxID=56615 RepID=A0A5B0RGS7_PUCGR|nr:hypothetical protein PGTUg99_005528 [Puccinia graminis f. sp. tritici]